MEPNPQWKPPVLEKSTAPSTRTLPFGFLIVNLHHDRFGLFSVVPGACVWYTRYRELASTHPRVVASISADKTRLAVGESVTIRLHLKNASKKELKLFRGHGYELDKADDFTTGRCLQRFSNSSDAVRSRDEDRHYIGPYYVCGNGMDEEHIEMKAEEREAEEYNRIE